MAGIEQHHDQTFVARFAEMAGKYARSIGGAFDRRSLVKRFDLQATGQFEGGLDFGGLGEADAVDGG